MNNACIMSLFFHDLLSFVILTFTLICALWIIWRFIHVKSHRSLRTVAILVLGDIGRSPRMMYHAQSFAETGFVTDLIGYGGSKPIPSLELPKLQLRYIPEPPKLLRYLPFVLAAPLKIVHQVTSILVVILFWIKTSPEFILVQNPPSIPTLMLVQLIAWLRGSKVIIDWHNLGYSILALKLGSRHPAVRLYEWLERFFGRSAYAHIFVTHAMKEFLVQKWDLRGRKEVLYDRPPHHFRRSTAQRTHELFRKLQSDLILQTSLKNFLPQTSTDSTIMTVITTQPSIDPLHSNLRMPVLRSDRPALLVSSTSWTPDEDFGILLQALIQYEMRAKELADKKSKQEGKTLPKLLVVVTGKGPLRDKYMAEIDIVQKSWEWVRCISLWLEAEDYPIILGSADLGVCLHSSSSGLDLPMKVVDMFGCGLPVCALSFACLSELIKDNQNGLVFKDASQLAEQLERLFASFPNSIQLNLLSASLLNSSNGTPRGNPGRLDDRPSWSTWEENWNHVMRLLILRDVNL